MTSHWQLKARNKASEERRKAKKQGTAIYDFVVKVREERELKAKSAIQEVTGVDSISGTDNEGKGDDL